MSLWLTEDELVELTGYKTNRKQKQALAEMNVAFRSRPADGFPLVERRQFENGGTASKPKLREPKLRAKPNWAALDRDAAGRMKR